MAKGRYKDWLRADKLMQLTAWARDGLTDEQIAHNIGITASTLYYWKNRYSEISEALKKGKEVVDIEVENALLKRALGYEFMEEKVEINDDRRKTTRTIKHVPGDTTAQIYWLKNRKSAEWRDKQKELSDGTEERYGVVVLPSVELELELDDEDV